MWDDIYRYAQVILLVIDCIYLWCPGWKEDPNLPPGTGFVYKLVVEESDKEKFERRRSVETKVCILAKDTRPEAKRLFEELPLPCNSVSGVRQYALVS